MADRVIAIETPATSQDLLTVAEAKLMLGLSATDTSLDEQLALQISIASTTIAELANRMFGEETLTETWREIGNGRLFLSHWPIDPTTGIIDVTAGGASMQPSEYTLESDSGKLAVYANGGMSNWNAPAVVHYTGGYKLPDDAPLPLKQACAILVREERIRNQTAHVAGIRSLSHKDARVMFFDPNALLMRTIGAKSPGMQTAENLIKQYMRHEC